MTRYSNTVSEIESILTWWRTLTEVDRASIPHINKLVDACETVFHNERSAWVATSMANKMLAHAAGQKAQSDDVKESDPKNGTSKADDAA